MLSLASPASLESASERVARVIFEHAALISMQDDVDSLLQLNADLARDLIGAERCSLWLLDDRSGELWTKVAHGISAIRIPMHAGLVGACFHENQTIVVNDVYADERFLQTVDASSGYETRSAMCIPLQADGAAIGVLQALNKADGFSPQDAEILRFMSIYSAAAIQSERLRHATESARLIRRELDIASDVQRRLLPSHLNAVKNIEYVGFCRPAKTVGGDYFDFLELADGSFAFTLGDVAGKGFPAAVLMASIHTLLRHLLLHKLSNLSTIITELNQTIYLSSSAERYSTLFSAMLSPDRSRLTFVNAGHLSPILLRRDGTIETFQQGDMPLGLQQLTEFHEHCLNLQSGDLVICISDGILEAEDVNGQFWDPSIIDQTLLRYRNHPVSVVVDALIHAVDQYTGKEHQFDDMTVIAIRIASGVDSVNEELV